jgi:hypothetical protein
MRGFDMKIRPATREDNDLLCALERRVPLEFGDQRLFFDRSDFFAHDDMQERSVVMLAEEGGEMVGVCAGALNEAPVGGQKRLLLYIHQERIAPEHQRRGIGGALTTAISTYWKEQDVGHIDSSYWFIGRENLKSRGFAERSGNKAWPEPIWLGTFDALDGDATPRKVGAGPVFDIVRLINATHAGKELFAPYEQVDFGKRLSRSVDYGWGDVYGRFVDGRLVAVAGIWDSGRTTAFKSSEEDPGTRSWTVADYGFERGYEQEMAKLIEELACLAGRNGRAGLTFFPEPGSKLYGELKSLPHEIGELLFYTPRIQPPARPAPVYLDPLIF